jgi:dipeptidyl aminopeptidase/acylaminoacyl peptidase
LFALVLWGQPIVRTVATAQESRHAEPLLTVAEKSNFTATSRHADVVDFCQRLAKLSPVVRLGELGASVEGRKLPLVIMADPPVTTAAEAARSGKLIVYVQGNIHAGEVDGKEALMMLARELATAKERPLLKDLIIVFAPIFNADGNEKIAKTNRPTDAGPEEGAGVRHNAQGLDLNRDFVKLESPEVRALVRFLNQWNPAIFVDMHTTNGSHHRYTLTYEGPRSPAGDLKVVDFVRDTMFPDLTRRLKKRGGYESFFYGNFSRDRSRWETVLATPRYGIHYVGLRNRIAILSESYAYAPYKDRVIAGRDFVWSILECAAANKEAIEKLLSEARSAAAKGTGTIALQHKATPLPQPVTLLGFVEEEKDGRRIATNTPKDYRVEYFGRTEATLAVKRPSAYLVPGSMTKAVETLQRHGVEMDELREDIELDVEVYRVDDISHSRQPFQKHSLVSLQATPRAERRRVAAGTVVVKMSQPLGSLAAYLLEPQSEDGLATWNFFDDALQKGRDFPVLRLPAQPPPLTTCRLRPLPEDRVMNKTITYEMVYGSGGRDGGRGSRGSRGGSGINLGGSPITVMNWLDDGEHYLQNKNGRLFKVNALTGRSQPYTDPAKLSKCLSTFPTIDAETARALAESTSLHFNPARTGALFEHEDDLYYCNIDGTEAVRLTKSPGRKELTSFSPDGKFVAFVRDHNLFVVDLATQTEKALTTDGNGIISNGKADWVYFEEIFNRNWRAYWWSPDSSRLAFLRFDDSPVHKFTVIDHIPTRLKVETTPYPKAGDPNPLVKLGIVTVGGGPIGWADLSNYSEGASLLIRAGFTPDSERVYFYLQDRAQTWLDFCTMAPTGGQVKRLFRETTKAWVDDLGEPKFLKDGSFLLPSERTGWKHFYLFDADGKLKHPVTSGPWEARTLHRVDEANGWVYLSGTRDNPIASNLYRAKLDGSSIERLTQAPGDHRVQLSPKANLFVDNWSSYTTPAKVNLYRTDGTLARTLDTNPVYALEEYRLGKYELVHIVTPDGVVLEGSVVKPADFDPQPRYPVWFMTYAGPHTPTIHDTWSGGHVNDHALASLGFIIFRCDPRSASGKGACATWTAYRQLGVPELKDIETAIRWISSFPYVDPSRMGMSGHSYGGFITAFALTHSKLFAAGIAGAPVTDWRNYDTIYTERYMNTPQENPDGYNATSVVKAAGNLHGRLLILHGLMDDNVHVQNTAQLVQELQRANKDFEMMIYPQARHGIFGAHYQRLMVEFMQRALKPEKSRPSSPVGLLQTRPD